MDTLRSCYTVGLHFQQYDRYCSWCSLTYPAPIIAGKGSGLRQTTVDASLQNDMRLTSLPPCFFLANFREGLLTVLFASNWSKSNSSISFGRAIRTDHSTEQSTVCTGTPIRTHGKCPMPYPVLCCHVTGMWQHLWANHVARRDLPPGQGLQTNMFGISDDLREEVKKRVYLTSNVDEFNCSSGPLTGELQKKPKNMFIGLWPSRFQFCQTSLWSTI